MRRGGPGRASRDEAGRHPAHHLLLRHPTGGRGVAVADGVRADAARRPGRRELGYRVAGARHVRRELEGNEIEMAFWFVRAQRRTLTCTG